MAGSEFPTQDLNPEGIESYLTFAQEIAREAGEGIAESFRSRSFSVSDKEDGSPVTEADQEAERLLRERIGDQFPEHGIIGEEFGEKAADREFVWVIDPIDGTKSFVHGVPLFGTLIGLLYRRRPIIGLIYQPVLGRMVAGDNRQTFLNGAPVKVREARALSDATLLLTDPADPLLIERGQAYLDLLGSAGMVRSWGDCFGYLSLVMGLADAMIDPVLNPWDLYPLIPILRGAGAVITNCEGGDAEKGNSLVASTSQALHEELLKILSARSA